MYYIRTISRSEFRGSSRGAASAEAVVVLPVFIIIFASVLYVRSQVLSRQAAETKARACAWAFSTNNCGAIPPGCEDIVRKVDGAAGVVDEIEKDLLSARGGLVGPVVAKVIEPALKCAFGSALDANTKQSYQRPSLYGGGTATASGSYHLACNLAHETLIEVANDAWKSLFSF
jgi:hypothetical protein